MIHQLAALFGLTLVAFVSPLTPSAPYGVCEGLGTKPAAGPLGFECVNHNCDPGCVQNATTTPFGAGKVCQCGYIGPQPDCCALVFVPGAPGFTKQGNCNAPGCNTAGACLALVIPPNPAATPPTPEIYIVNCTKGGIGNVTDG